MSIELNPQDIDNFMCAPQSFEALPPQRWPDQWHPSEDFPTPQSVLEDKFSQILDDGLSFRPAAENYRLGNPKLPVAAYREHIVQTVLAEQNVILSSPTGTGKSSQTGLYLIEDGAKHGIERVFISSPRILAARQLMGWARLGLGHEYEQIAGYLTGTARDSDAGPESKLVYVTEQLLFKMANRGELGSGDVVMPDEAHERTPAMILLQGLMRELMQDNPRMKLLISSATMDTERHARHFTDTQTGKPAAVIELRGITHPITDIHTDKKVAQVAKEYMQTSNVLAFEPGETRQLATRAQMTDRKNGHTVHILNANMSPSEQTKALNPDDKNHLVGNKTAETSITPDGKNTVVDGGLSNIGLYQRGVRVLKTVHSSKATMMQRRGRIGRTGPGTYIVAVPENATPKAFEDRDEYDISPIETSSVASYIAELLVSGRKIENMDIIEHPTSENLAHDYKLLKRLGAITVHDGKPALTEIGRSIVDLPLDVSLSRMLVEARSIDQMYEVEAGPVRLQVAAAAAIRQVNGILNAWNYSRKRYMLSRGKEDNLSIENTSDMLFELDVFIKLREKHKKLESSDDEDWQEKFEMHLRAKDIFVNRYYKALSTFEELCRREGLNFNDLETPSAEERSAVIGCQIAGTEELFVQKGKYNHRDIRGDNSRRLGRRSTIDPSRSSLVVGTAFDLVGLRDTGHFRRAFIVGGSAVTPSLIERHAPHRVTKKSLSRAVTKDGDFIQKQALYFDGDLAYGEVEARPEPTIETREFIIRAMMKGIARAATNRPSLVAYDSGTPQAQLAKEQWDKAQELEHKTELSLFTNKRYEKLIGQIVRKSVAIVPLDVMDPAALDTVIPPIDFETLIRPSRRKQLQEIEQRAPGIVNVEVNNEFTAQLPVTYKHNIAYITVPRHMQYKLKRSDIAAIAEHHPVKLRLDTGAYTDADNMLDRLEERRTAAKRQKRFQRRAEAATQKSTPEGLKEAGERLRASKKPGKGKFLPNLLTNPQKSETQTNVSDRKKQRGKSRRFRALKGQSRQLDLVKS